MSEEIKDNLLEDNDMNYLKSTMVRTHLDDINLLEDMGFSYTLIRKVFSFLRPQSIEQAINYMTKENGVYQHEFREGKKFWLQDMIKTKEIFRNEIQFFLEKLIELNENL